MRIHRAALFLMFAALAGCGVKSPPLPAVDLLPAEVKDLSYFFNEEGLLEATFRPPSQTVAGEPLRSLAGFYVDRSENRITPAFCAQCPVEYDDRLEIPAEPPPPGKLTAEREYRFTDDLRPGFAYHYRVYAHDADGDYAPERFASLIVHYDSPSRPPEGLDVSTADRLVMLRWPSPDRLVDGRPAVDVSGYHVYRRVRGGDWVRLNPEEHPVRTNYYEDDQVVNGRKYSYRVRAVRTFRGSVIAGPPSVEATATPADLTPPPPPVKVYAAPTNQGVSLAWDAVEAADAAGYRVYRRRGDESAFGRIGPDLIKENRFLDGSARRGLTYEYRVTTVDDSPQANESEPAPSARIRYE